MPPLPRKRSHLSHAALRRAPASLAPYLMGAAVLALLLTGGLVLIDLRGRGGETAQQTVRTGAPAPRPQTSAVPPPPAPAPALPAPAAPPPAASAVAPPVPAAPIEPPRQLAQPAQPAESQTPPSPAIAAAPPLAPPAPAETANVPPVPSARSETERDAPATAALGHWVVESPRAPMHCLSERIRTVLAELAQAVGEVEILSTTELHTDNHSPGSVRAKMHADCKAVDLRVRGKLAEAVAHLRARPELGAVQSYRNGVIHIDFDNRGTERSAAPVREAPRRRTRAARAEPAEVMPPEPAPAPAPGPAPSPFAPVARPDIVR